MRGRKDLEEDGAAVQAEARAVDVKVKSAEAGEAAPAGNIELLKKIQDDKWESYEWFDAEVRYYILTLLSYGICMLIDGLIERGSMGYIRELHDSPRTRGSAAVGVCGGRRDVSRRYECAAG